MAVVPVDVLAFGAHPDDVELGCGGTLAALVARGYRVGICDLTRGEAGTRGTPETRAAEARRAAEILGASFRATLDLGDGNLRTDRAAELEVISVVRAARPRIALAPWVTARHPDHARASRLVAEAVWYSGLRSLDTGVAAWRPQQVLFYASSPVAGASFLVDVTAVFETKIRAIGAYQSQFHDPAATGPETYISTKGFRDGIRARAQALGQIASVAYAEAFLAHVPPRVDDPVTAFEGYEPGFPK
ncbi:MAG TPA: bacillithiol biosynthesis deacetylase BshB1 [Thermoanaerobaculia bacterium]|nr:bacillithiol biosynthesis deacetylase BshB1 [Thermoanaerobaculia bacterium]